MGSYLLSATIWTSNHGSSSRRLYRCQLRLPLLIALAGAALIAAALCAYNIWRAGDRLPIAASTLVFAVSIVQTIVPGLFQSYWVKPDELSWSRATLPSNIEFTRYGLRSRSHHQRAVPRERKLTRR